MLTGERGLPIASALRFSCFPFYAYVRCHMWHRHIKGNTGMEVSPETAEKVML